MQHQEGALWPHATLGALGLHATFRGRLVTLEQFIAWEANYVYESPSCGLSLVVFVSAAMSILQLLAGGGLAPHSLCHAMKRKQCTRIHVIFVTTLETSMENPGPTGNIGCMQIAMDQT